MGRKSKGSRAMATNQVIINAPKIARFRRTIVDALSLSADASGIISNATDLSTRLAAQSAFTSSAALFERLIVRRILVTLTPRYQFSGTTPALVGSAVSYYDTDSSSVATSLPDALHKNRSVLWTTGNHQVSFAFEPVMCLGVKTLVNVADFTAAGGFLGYLSTYGLNFLASNSAVYQTVSYDVEFAYAK